MGSTAPMSAATPVCAAGANGVAPAACSTSAPGGPYCLTFTGSQFDIHVGQQFKIALVSAADGHTVVAHTTFAALPSAGFSVSLSNSMQKGVSYYIDYYADENGNKTCDPPKSDGSSDHVWRSHAFIDFTHGSIQSVSATSDFVCTVVHDDPWISDPTGNNTCPQLNTF
jgi:hypothetical protein